MKYLLAAAWLLLLTGCAQKPEPEETVTLPVRQVSAVGLNARTLDFYTERLANALFASGLASEGAMSNSALAVSSFLPVRQLSLTGLTEQEVELANQLAESMLTAAVQRGFAAIDFRLRRELLLLPEHEQALSRQLADVTQRQAARAMLTGTFSTQEDGVIVNVRIIDLNSQQVLAAATDFIPHNVLWSAEKIRKRGNYLYRSERIGEKP